jgi:DNA-binding HxlR family transcriptional regulator
MIMAKRIKDILKNKCELTILILLVEGNLNSKKISYKVNELSKKNILLPKTMKNLNEVSRTLRKLEFNGFIKPINKKKKNVEYCLTTKAFYVSDDNSFFSQNNKFFTFHKDKKNNQDEDIKNMLIFIKKMIYLIKAKQNYALEEKEVQKKTKNWINEINIINKKHGAFFNSMSYYGLLLYIMDVLESIKNIINIDNNYFGFEKINKEKEIISKNNKKVYSKKLGYLENVCNKEKMKIIKDNFENITNEVSEELTDQLFFNKLLKSEKKLNTKDMEEFINNFILSIKNLIIANIKMDCYYVE